VTIEQNKAMVRRLFEDVFNNGNLATIDELWVVGRAAAAKQRVMNLRTAFPDYHRTVEEQFAVDDSVVTLWTARGTHQGMYVSEALGRSIVPTGKPIEVGGISLHRIVDGRIVNAYVVGNDSVELLQQIGAIPAADTAAAITR
jgi:ketosteroid isomerase-like protein